VPIDVPSAFCSALDVTAPAPQLRDLQRRAFARAEAEQRRRVRAMLAAASLLVLAALFGGGVSGAQAAPPHVASVPAPAPLPQAT
jgi:hypothetical protein